MPRCKVATDLIIRVSVHIERDERGRWYPVAVERPQGGRLLRAVHEDSWARMVRAVADAFCDGDYDRAAGLYLNADEADQAAPSGAKADPDAPWPDGPGKVGCGGECGFVRAGVGWQCLEGEACGRYVHTDDPGFAEITAHYKGATEEEA